MRIYDPNEVILNIGGADITGYAPGTFISVAMDEDAFKVVIGAAGDVVRSKSNNRMAALTVTLLQTSPSNDLLSTVHNLDQAGRNGAGVFAIELRDAFDGRAVFTSGAAWIQKAPDATFGDTDSNRAWTIRIEKLVRFDGGA